MGPAGIPPVITRRMDPDRDPNRCAWFLQCENPAEYEVDHPTLDKVPACGRCLTKVGLMEEAT